LNIAAHSKQRVSIESERTQLQKGIIESQRTSWKKSHHRGFKAALDALSDDLSNDKEH
jgi:hypothetical protein